MIRGRNYKEMDHLARDAGHTTTGGIDSDFGGLIYPGTLPRNLATLAGLREHNSGSLQLAVDGYSLI